MSIVMKIASLFAIATFPFMPQASHNANTPMYSLADNAPVIYSEPTRSYNSFFDMVSPQVILNPIMNDRSIVGDLNSAADNTLDININMYDMQLKTSTISVSSVRIDWAYEDGHVYDVACTSINRENESYDCNIRYNQKTNGMCYITGLRENSEYVIALKDLTTNTQNTVMAKTESVVILTDYEYISGWTGCYTFEYASSLTHNPSKSAIAGAVVDPVTGTGIMRDEYGDYCVAMGLYYGRCGDRFLVELENGVQFTVKICDSKGKASDGQGIYHRFGYDRRGKNIIEFIVSSAPACVEKSGDYGIYAWDGLIFDNIKSIHKIEYGNTVTY